MLADILVRLI